MLDFETLPIYWLNRPSAQSRRELSQRICLTERGRALEQPLAKIAMPMIARAMDGILQHDAETTRQVLTRMVENLSQTRN